MAKVKSMTDLPDDVSESKGFKCAIGRERFKMKAKALPLIIDGQTNAMSPREFSTGSFGWYMNGKVSIIVDGVEVRCQCNMSMTVIGSKEV